MTDGIAGALTVLLIALGMYAGRLYERRSGTGSRLREKELGDAVKNVQDNLNSMSDADLINSITHTGTVKKSKSTNTPDS